MYNLLKELFKIKRYFIIIYSCSYNGGQVTSSLEYQGGYPNLEEIQQWAKQDKLESGYGKIKS